MQPTTRPRKKLIEVALPLEAINKESAREKSIRHGHPSTLHLWWARRPLAACRAVLFASLVDDPASCPEEFPSEDAQEAERQRLFRVIEDLVKWENSNNEAVLHRARTEIARSAARNQGVSLPHQMTPAEVAAALKQYAPPVLDPFAGGGSIPLEAQRLGLEAHASDLNPVAVLINKALIEIPPKFANCPPVHPVENQALLQREWRGAQGLAEDVRYYGKWMREEAWKRIGHLYPKVTLPKEQGGGEATVIAWLWARTVKCPNPACGAQMPLTRSFWLSKNKGKYIWTEPSVDRIASPPIISFTIKTDKGEPSDGTINRRGATCVACNNMAPLDYVRAEGKAGRIGTVLTAIVAEGKGGRIYLPPIAQHEVTAKAAAPEWQPMAELSQNPRHMSPPLYGITTFSELFTPRQLVALDTFSSLVGDVRDQILVDMRKRGLLDKNSSLGQGSTSTQTYADAVATYLALIVDKQADLGNALNRWEPVAQCPRQLFARQAIPMVWDFAEGNPLGTSSGSWAVLLENLMRSFQSPLMDYVRLYAGTTKQSNAMDAIRDINQPLISTDPPYYDNVPYADLADFFYVWLRRSLSDIYPDLFSTLLVPKSQELVADPFRQGGFENAQKFFEEGLGKVFTNIRQTSHSAYPLTVYYAFKQSESEVGEDEQDHHDTTPIASTGWETMLEGMLKANFAITGTWPIRTEMGSRMRGQNSNALATSIVLVSRPRPENASLTSRGEFLRSLKRELPAALKDLQRGNIAPVDLAQAAIGPGMAVFSRYSKVLEADGSAMRVRTALQLINQALDEVLAEQEGEYDAETRWAVAWFEQYGLEEGQYGVAETLSKAKNTAVERLVEAGILSARGGKVRLLRRDELADGWHPARQPRLTAWEVTQRLIKALMDEHGGGEQGAAAILDQVGGLGEIARDLAYRLYTTCERKGWAQEALAYNSLVVDWRDIAGEAARLPVAEQAKLL